MFDDVKIPKHTVIQYVRNKKRIPCGVIVAVKTPEGFAFGYSLCNKKKDLFNKRTALKIAIGRAISKTNENCLPSSISKIASRFTERCNKYYKVSAQI